MQKYFIHIIYDGSNFHGWQIQKNAISIQEKLQAALEKILGNKTEVTGAGRTDTGVHAKKLIAHFELNEKIEDLDYFKHQLNGILPNEIAIRQLWNVKSSAHARFDASSRTYEYFLHFSKDPFLMDHSYLFTRELNFNNMNEAAKLVMKHSDFTSFSKLHSETKTNLCKIDEANWKLTSDGAVFRITADRFLRNMVRAIVGTLIEVGVGKLKVDDINKIIESRDRSNAGYSVPAHGLYLVDIKYPINIYE